MDIPLNSLLQDDFYVNLVQLLFAALYGYYIAIKQSDMENLII